MRIRRVNYAQGSRRGGYGHLPYCEFGTTLLTSRRPSRRGPMVKEAMADQNPIESTPRGGFAHSSVLLDKRRRSSAPARWLLTVLCLDVLWLGFVRLPALLGRD